jgi:hypothetical protein
MPNEKPIVENSKKIEKIYQIIEFEIENAYNQLSLFKKDNVNFILLILALIGFFAFIPFDVFLYKWFEWGIINMIVCVGCIVCISLVSLYRMKKRNKYPNQSEAEELNDDQECDSCASYTVCKNINDPKTKEKIRKYLDIVLIENNSLFYSAYIYTGFFFLITSLLTYFYFASSDSSKQILSAFQENLTIEILLLLMVIAYIGIYYQNHRLAKKGVYKDYLSQLLFLSSIILAFAFLIEIYGNYSKIPPFIAIKNTSQFSSGLFEHSTIIPSFPLSLIILLYIGVLNLALIEYFFSSRYIKKVNQKLDGLFGLKYKIDRYQLGITPELHIKQALSELSRLRINPPVFLTLYGIIVVPIPFELNQCEDILYLALEDLDL